MKAKKDEIERLLDAYKTTSAKRIAKEKEIEDREREEERARYLFEENLKKKIKEVFRPVMKKLLSRLDKKLFKIEVEKLGDAEDISEYYRVTSRKEKDTELWFCLTADDEGVDNLARFEYYYSVGEEVECSEELILKVEDINEAIITKKFLFCLKGICV